MNITLVGMGCGSRAGLTLAGTSALEKAECILGAQRLLQALPEGCTQNRAALYKTDALLARIEQYKKQRVAVVFSGDTGFYSGAATLCRALDAQGLPYTVEPGVSSVQLLAAALGRTWQDWELASAHGCACDPVQVCRKGIPTFFLTGGCEDPASVCATLDAAGCGEVQATVGENLGYATQRLVRGLSSSSVYLSGKVPYVFDYADHDTDVNHHGGSDHGTHVAGIVAANPADGSSPP